MRRVLLSVLGWLLVAAGLVLYPLPGPGLLVLVLGVAVLARHDPWAARRLEPVSRRALVETRRSVETWPRFVTTFAVTVALGASGLLWLADPARPDWWALPAWTWFPGGLWAGFGQLVSGLLGAAVAVGFRVSVMNTLSGSGR